MQPRWDIYKTHISLQKSLILLTVYIFKETPSIY